MDKSRYMTIGSVTGGLGFDHRQKLDHHARAERVSESSEAKGSKNSCCKRTANMAWSYNVCSLLPQTNVCVWMDAFLGLDGAPSGFHTFYPTEQKILLLFWSRWGFCCVAKIYSRSKERGTFDSIPICCSAIFCSISNTFFICFPCFLRPCCRTRETFPLWKVMPGERKATSSEVDGWGCFGLWILALFIIPSQMGSRRLPGYIFCLVFPQKKSSKTTHSFSRISTHVFMLRSWSSLSLQL